MADSITVPELPPLNRASGDELIAVWKDDRLVRLPQASLRGTQTFSGPSDPPLDVATIMALDPVLGDRWRNTETSDEWKVTALEPFTWTYDGNLKGEPGVGIPGPPGVGKTGPAGPSGRVETKVAGTLIPNWTAVVLDPDDRFRPADPSNPLHRQRVVGVVASGGPFGASLVAQTAGTVKGPDGSFVTGKTLFVGPGGSLVATPPTSGWSQVVATAASSEQILVALGEARVIADEGTALIAPSGFAGAASAADVAAGEATDKFVTPSALSPVLKGKLGLEAFLQAAASFNQPAATKTILDWLADLMTEGAELRALGFKGDGRSHPLSERFGAGSTGLAAAKAVFPRALSLNEEIDGHAIQRRIDLAVTGNYGSCTVLPRGSIALTSFPIDSTATIACHVSSPGPATIKCVGTATGCWVHGTEANRALGPFSWRNVDLDTSSPVATTGLITFFGTAGIGRASALTIEDARFNRFTRGWLLGNCPRGVRTDNLMVFGPDFAMQPGGGVEIVATADCTYGCFSYKFTNCLIANYTWGFNASAASVLEGMVFENCRAYNGFGLCQAICTKPNYRSLLWTFQDCDWEGSGFALDMTNVRTLKVDGGFWHMRCQDTRPFPASVQTDNGERRMFNLHNVQGFDFQRLEMVASGGADGDPLPTNLVLANVDSDCSLGLFDGNLIVTDHVTATCLFRLAGTKAATVVERNTRINYTWGTTPTVLYAGTGVQPYQVSTSDVADKSGSVSSAGFHSFSGVTVITTGSNGRATIPLPLRAPGVLPFFRNAPTVRLTSANSNGGAAALTLVSASSTAITVEAAGAASNVTVAVHWEASGF